jgi:ubiquinone/menaquinone biosynthesis C-methylase UbiE
VKKILILAYDFPPYNSMGSQRPSAWFKYFKDLGYFPTVVTRHWGDSYKNAIDYIKPSEQRETTSTVTESGEIINVPYTPNYRDRLILKHGLHSKVVLRKISTLFYSILQYAFFFFDSRKEIYFAADEYLKNHKPDFIIATGEPYIMLRYASKLSRKYSIPWIADYRDCWSLDLYLLENKYRFLERFIYTLFEKHYVKSASLITTVAPLYQGQLQALFPHIKVEIVQNGYFEEDYSNIDLQKTSTQQFIISFGGTIYPFHTLEVFLEGLKLFIKSDGSKKVMVNFFGSNFDSFQKERILKNSIGIEEYIIITDRLSRVDLYNEFSKSACLLIFDNKMAISGKLYEYLPLNIKILMAGNDNGPIEEILKLTNSGIVCDTAKDVAEKLNEMYEEWEKTGKVDCNSKNIEQYSRRNQTKHLAELLAKIDVDKPTLEKSLTVYNNIEIVKSYAKELKITAPESTILKLVKDKALKNTMLDIGVGAGRTTRYFAYLFNQYFGIDYSEKMISSCKNTIAGHNITFQCADARNLNMFEDHYFDFIFFSFNGIDSVSIQDRTRILLEIKRLAHKDSIVAFSSHNKYAIKHIYNFKPPRNIFHIPMELKRRKFIKKLNPSYQEIQHESFFTFKDGAHDFKLEVMYVDPNWQIKELMELGFTDISVYSLHTGKSIPINQLNEGINDPWLYYVCNVNFNR